MILLTVVFFNNNRASLLSTDGLSTGEAGSNDNDGSFNASIGASSQSSLVVVFLLLIVLLRVLLIFVLILLSVFILIVSI